PDGSARGGGDDGTSEGNHFNKWQPEVGMHLGIADLVRTAHFHPDVLCFQQIQEQLKTRLARTFGRLHPCDMVNNHGNRHSPDAVFLFQQIFLVDVQIHRPTEFHDVLHAAIQDIELYVAARPVEQVQTDAADAAFVQSL